MLPLDKCARAVAIFGAIQALMALFASSREHTTLMLILAAVIFVIAAVCQAGYQIEMTLRANQRNKV